LLLYGAICLTGIAGPRWPVTARSRLQRSAAALAAAGAVMMIGGCVTLGKALTPNPRPRDDSPLITNGTYALARHPIYGGVILSAIAWSLWLSPAALAPTAVTGAFLHLKSLREESWLEERHPGYALYRARVRNRFLPLLW
jgi:protein-S-isoprenylcysteine O-methyltransferase Ste14